MKWSLIREIALSSHGGELTLADVEGDSELELLLYQGPGIYHGGIFGDMPNVAERGPKHGCLTAVKLDGTVLWQSGEPNPPDPPFLCHGAEFISAAKDINGDGRVEVVWIDGQRLVLLDGPTGRLLVETELPLDNFSVVSMARSGDGGGILVGTNVESYPPWQYANPIVCFDRDLNIRWGPRHVPGAGHMAPAVDVDGDGVEEWVIGYLAMKLGGDTVWSVSGLDLDSIDADEEHVDTAAIIPGESPRETRVVLAASSYVYVCDGTGQTLVRVSDKHPQGALLGNFSGNDKSLAVYNAYGPLSFFDLAGRPKTQVETPHLWPFRPPSGENMRFHGDRPIWLLPGDPDAVLFCDGGWPYVVDVEGRIHDVFSPPPNARQPEMDVPAGSRGNDYGVGWLAHVADLDGDGDVEVLVHDRRHAWVYKL